jgi:hypothetical protein
MELAPYIRLFSNQYAGCQGFIGPFPSAFLISDVKRTGAKIITGI